MGNLWAHTGAIGCIGLTPCVTYVCNYNNEGLLNHSESELHVNCAQIYKV